MVKPQLGFASFRGLFTFGLVLVLSLVITPAKCQDDSQVMGILRNMIQPPVSFQWSDPNVCKWKHVQCGPGKRVTAIQIGNQNLQGSLPKELEKLTELVRFECQGNALTGSFPYLSKSLQRLVIHRNKFSSFPSDFFKGMSSLQEVRMDNNPFLQWQVPDSLRDCVALQIFSAESANLVGTIPEFFGKDGPFPGLVYLSLSDNSLEGGLPETLGGSSIENLLVNGQNSNSKLNGTLAVLQKMTSLKQIWAHGNAFTGPIPDLSKLNQLFDLGLRDNQLTGVVPPSLWDLPSLKVVNLTNNNFQGPIPKFRDGVAVDNDLGRGRNQFCTSVPGEPCSPLVNVLLSVVEPLGYPLKFAESWQGNDPCANKWIGIVCSGGNITVINFQNMGLSGTISPNFASITSLTKLLLANNAITGTIPKELTSMPLLQELDLSNNQLYGRKPSFRDGVDVKLGGNPDIGKNKPSSQNGSGSGGNKRNVTAIVVGIVVGVVILLGVVAAILFYRRKWKQEAKAEKKTANGAHPRRYEDGKEVKIQITSDGVGGEGTNVLSPTCYQGDASNMVISIEVLRDVTDNFNEENILGKGGFGTVYKGELHDGTKIAVKRMQLGTVGETGLNEFMAEIGVLTKVRHKHLVALLGYCLDASERLLVYEYMSQGALSTHLFNWKVEGLKPLEWKTRLSVALDVARGVEYLHVLGQQIFIHRDLKPSNILLGDDMHAKVSDFGLVRLVPEGKASFQTRLAGTFGYMAPEYAATGRLTTKVDVYSFGVILMEMITGRRALDNSLPDENIHLVTWFRKMLMEKDSLRTIIDPAIEVDEETYTSISTVAELAGQCTATDPYPRPDMSHVVNMLLPLIEVWKPTKVDAEDVYGINFNMTLPEALQRWQDFEGTSTLDLSLHNTTSGDNTRSNTTTQQSDNAGSFTPSSGP